MQSGYPLRPAFLSRVKESYFAPVEEMEFADSPDVERVAINRWVESQTRDRIRDLIPAGALKPQVRLVLINALYLRAPWAEEFSERATKPARFLVHGREVANVPTMTNLSSLGYGRRDGFQVVTRPYHGGELQFVIVLPDEPTGLAMVERALTPDAFQEFTRLAPHRVSLHLPKFRIEPPTVPLDDRLKNLGMKTAFDAPKGSANFERMAPRTPREYLAIGAVLHKTFLALDENGTEAAAATAVMMLSRAMAPRADLEIRVDRPFLFAIQHVASGACLFLGRVTDPR